MGAGAVTGGVRGACDTSAFVPPEGPSFHRRPGARCGCRKGSLPCSLPDLRKGSSVGTAIYLCPVCDRRAKAAPSTFRNGGPHGHPLFDGLTLWSCSSCGSAWAAPAPTDAELGDYYANSYQPARMSVIDRDRWPMWDSRPASLILLGRLFGRFPGGGLFVDVGPGNGASLSLAPLMLPSPRIGCVEFNERSIEFFARHNPDVVVRQSLDAFDDGSVNLLHSAHSLEHFRPDGLRGVLGQARTVLAPDGTMVLEVPAAPSVKAVGQINHTPHLLFFSQDGLVRLLERCGFEVVWSRVVAARTRAGQAHTGIYGDRGGGCIRSWMPDSMR